VSGAVAVASRQNSTTSVPEDLSRHRQHNQQQQHGSTTTYDSAGPHSGPPTPVMGHLSAAAAAASSMNNGSHAMDTARSNLHILEEAIAMRGASAASNSSMAGAAATEHGSTPTSVKGLNSPTNSVGGVPDHPNSSSSTTTRSPQFPHFSSHAKPPGSSTAATLGKPLNLSSSSSSGGSTGVHQPPHSAPPSTSSPGGGLPPLSNYTYIGPTSAIPHSLHQQHPHHPSHSSSSYAPPAHQTSPYGRPEFANTGNVLHRPQYLPTSLGSSSGSTAPGPGANGMLVDVKAEESRHTTPIASYLPAASNQIYSPSHITANNASQRQPASGQPTTLSNPISAYTSASRHHPYRNQPQHYPSTSTAQSSTPTMVAFPSLSSSTPASASAIPPPQAPQPAQPVTNSNPQQTAPTAAAATASTSQAQRQKLDSLKFPFLVPRNGKQRRKGMFSINSIVKNSNASTGGGGGMSGFESSETESSSGDTKQEGAGKDGNGNPTTATTTSVGGPAANVEGASNPTSAGKAGPRPRKISFEDTLELELNPSTFRHPNTEEEFLRHDPVDAGVLSIEDAHTLFRLYMDEMVIMNCLLDPSVHTHGECGFAYLEYTEPETRVEGCLCADLFQHAPYPSDFVRKRSTFLYVAILSVISRYLNTVTIIEDPVTGEQVQKTLVSPVYSYCRKSARVYLKNVLGRLEVNLEVVQGLAVLTYHKEPEDEKACLHLYRAIAIARELGIDQATLDGKRNVTEEDRVWVRIQQRVWKSLFVSNTM